MGLAGAGRRAEVETLFHQLRPSASAWVRHHSVVANLIDACPIQGLIAASTRRS
jgi:hypothetical protein